MDQGSGHDTSGLRSQPWDFAPSLGTSLPTSGLCTHPSGLWYTPDFGPSRDLRVHNRFVMPARTLITVGACILLRASVHTPGLWSHLGLQSNPGLWSSMGHLCQPPRSS